MVFFPRVLMRPLMTGLITVPAWAEETAVHPLAPLEDDVELDGVVELVEFVPPLMVPPPVVVLFPVVVPLVVPLPEVVVVLFPFPVDCLFWPGSTNAPWSLTPSSSQ